MLEINDWQVAREVDIAAAAYIYGEEVNREIEREKRDREFWIAAFGGESESLETNEDISLEDAIETSALRKT